MEVTKIGELSQMTVSQEIRLKPGGCQVCIYYPDAPCRMPKLQFKICRGCPRAEKYIRKNILKSLFEQIKALAASWLQGNSAAPPATLGGGEGGSVGTGAGGGTGGGGSGGGGA